MTKRSRLLELAERCERATEPSRELDYEIRDTLWPGTPTDADLPRDFGYIHGVPDRGHAAELAREFRALKSTPTESEKS